ncbi:MAG: aminopeptidase P family protein [Planctomycetota bacterium]|nr:MAG: aminopeptidase P family protein [Planctomycetota bacterium]
MNPLERLRAVLQSDRYPALLVTHMPSIRWLTGFTGSSAVALVTTEHAVFITDSRYTLQAREEVRDFAVRSFSSPMRMDEVLHTVFDEFGVRRLAFDRNHVTVGRYQSWQEKWQGVELEPVDDPCESLRMIKAPEEIAKIREACRLADDCMRHVVDRLHVGKTERAILFEIHQFLWSHGAEASFAPIVVAGERSARPHGTASDRPLQPGDFLTLDLGARLDGLCSDITRTVGIRKLSDRQREIYHRVLEVQQGAIERLQPGANGRDVDAWVRETLGRHGLAEYFGHGLGHGLGLEVHDPGRLSPTVDQPITVGQVWTVEPGVYIEPLGGVRIEDDVLVTESGPEVLTHFPRDLLLVD